jgi:hypothetical protein
MSFKVGGVLASYWAGAQQADARSVYIAKLIYVITETSASDLDSMSIEVLLWLMYSPSQQRNFEKLFSLALVGSSALHLFCVCWLATVRRRAVGEHEEAATGYWDPE